MALFGNKRKKRPMKKTDHGTPPEQEAGASETAKMKRFSAAEEVKKQKTKKRRRRSFRRIGSREKIAFAKHLSVMLNAGIPLREALEVMEGQVSSNSMRAMLTVMIRDLSDGFTLSSALAKFPRAFKPFDVNIVRVGESSGTLANALQYLSLQLLKAHELRGKIRAALFYPVIIFIGAIGIASYLSLYILPRLIPLFKSLDVNLPITTRLMLTMSEFMTQYWFWVLGGLIGLILLLYILYRIRPIRYFVHRTILRIPIMGRLSQAIQISFFTRILGTLLQSGVQIVDAIKVTSNSSQQLVYKKVLSEIAENVERGEAITDELVKHPELFPRITIGMIKVGDRTGSLADSLMNAAEFAEQEVDDLTKNLATLIEPITLLGMGVLVGFIALSIITPIYQLTEGISR
ncbi:hypothetical protein GF380_02870 [Candidatus Uhrbacteria bacterium]|nr:hypothetical protein [Candidatus Uhrbacteria bacterium]MBD3284092.1 hypothetical protein [Candidatus Uhrbacteria bacterium]